MNELREKLNSLGGDLFKDLRDRRLLPVVGLLVAAIIAVPLLLGGGGAEQPAPASLATAELPEAEELDAVVLSDSTGVRDYRKRLAGQPRNPFKQQYPQSGSGGADADTEPAADAADGSSADSASSGLTTGDGSGSATPPVTEPSKPRRVTRMIRMTIDVRVSHAGNKRDIEGVEALALVPGEKSPIVRFTGATHDAARATFVLSPAVVKTWGDGNCDPGRNDCQFLTLEPGESQYFHYGPKAKRHRIKLLAINREVVRKSEVVSRGKRSAGESADVG